MKKLLMLTAIITGFSFIADSGNCSDNPGRKPIFKVTKDAYNSQNDRNNNNPKKKPMFKVTRYDNTNENNNTNVNNDNDVNSNYDINDDLDSYCRLIDEGDDYNDVIEKFIMKQLIDEGVIDIENDTSEQNTKTSSNDKYNREFLNKKRKTEEKKYINRFNKKMKEFNIKKCNDDELCGE